MWKNWYITKITIICIYQIIVGQKSFFQLAILSWPITNYHKIFRDIAPSDFDALWHPNWLYLLKFCIIKGRKHFWCYHWMIKAFTRIWVVVKQFFWVCKLLNYTRHLSRHHTQFMGSRRRNHSLMGFFQRYGLQGVKILLWFTQMWTYLLNMSFLCYVDSN